MLPNGTHQFGAHAAHTPTHTHMHGQELGTAGKSITGIMRRRRNRTGVFLCLLATVESLSMCAKEDIMPVLVLEVEQSLFMAPPAHTHTRIRIVIADFYASRPGGGLLLVSDVAHTPRCSRQSQTRPKAV